MYLLQAKLARENTSSSFKPLFIDFEEDTICLLLLEPHSFPTSATITYKPDILKIDGSLYDHVESSERILPPTIEIRVVALGTAAQAEELQAYILNLEQKSSFTSLEEFFWSSSATVEHFDAKHSRNAMTLNDNKDRIRSKKWRSLLSSLQVKQTPQCRFEQLSIRFKSVSK